MNNVASPKKPRHSRVLKHFKSHADPVCRVRVKPDAKLRVFLGSFDFSEKVKGFMIELAPNPRPSDSVHTHVTYSSGERNVKYFLDIINHDSRPVTAVVHHM